MSAFEEQDGLSGKSKNIETPAAPIEAIDIPDAPDHKAVKIDDATTMFVPQKHMEKSAPSGKNERRYSAQGEVGSSEGPFYARLTLSRKFNRFLLWDIGGFYSNHYNADYKRRFYAFETGPHLVLANPTIFHPFVGGSMGFEVWRQEDLRREKLDDARSMTLSYFAGLMVGLTKNFGLTLSQRFKNYVTHRPLVLAERRRQENPISSVDVGFVVMF